MRSVGAAYVFGDSVAVEVCGSAPGDGAGFLGDLEIVGEGAETKENVVMEVVGLAFTGGNSVDVEPGERRGGVRDELSAGLFDDFAAGGVPDLGIFGFDVAAGKEPAIQPAVMDQEDPFAVGGKDQAGAGDVARSELMAGKGSAVAFEEHQDQFARLGVGNVRGVADERWRQEQRAYRNEKSPITRSGLYEVNRATSYSPTYLRVQYHRG